MSVMGRECRRQRERCNRGCVKNAENVESETEDGEAVKIAEISIGTGKTQKALTEEKR